MGWGKEKKKLNFAGSKCGGSNKHCLLIHFSLNYSIIIAFARCFISFWKRHAINEKSSVFNVTARRSMTKRQLCRLLDVVELCKHRHLSRHVIWDRYVTSTTTETLMHVIFVQYLPLLREKGCIACINSWYLPTLLLPVEVKIIFIFIWCAGKIYFKQIVINILNK